MAHGGDGADGPYRRDFLKVTGTAALASSLAGCDDLGDAGRENRTGTATSDGGGGTDAWAARPAAVDTEFAAEEDDLVRDTFAEEYYTRLEGDIPGLDAPADAAPTGHAVTYGHQGAALGEDPPSIPTVNVLSAGTLSLPAPEGAGSNLFAEAPLSEVVGLEEGNLFLAAAGLGQSVEWRSDPVAVDRREAEFLEGTGTVETFVGVVSAAPGPGMPAGDLEPAAAMRGAGAPIGYYDVASQQPRGYLVTVHCARTFVGTDLVMVGMVGGWRRPPTMDPPATELGPEVRDLLGDLYEDVVRMALFVDVLGETGMLAAALMPDEDELPPPPESGGVRRASYSTTIGLDDDDQIELGYPTEDVHDDHVSNGFTVGRDVPPLLSGVAYDEDTHSRGTSYLVRAETRATAYTIDGDDGRAIPFGVVASPLVEVEGEQRNTLATGTLAEVMTDFDGVWDLLRWTWDRGDFAWTSGPTETERLSGPDLLGESGEVTAFRGTIEEVTHGDRREQDVFVFAARVRTADEVVVAVALSEDHGGGFFDAENTVKQVFREGVRRTVVNPDTPGEWVDASIDDLNLVQIVRNTRLETASGDVLGQPDPPLVAGRYTAPPFDVSTFDGTAFTPSDPEWAVFTFDVGDRPDPFETVLEKSSLADLDQGNVDPDVLFDGNRQQAGDATNDLFESASTNDLPVFELEDTDTSVTVEAYAPSGYRYDTRTVRAGEDYSITDLEVLRVGFITVSDPEDGTNYGDGDGGPTNYPTTVEAAFEFLKRTYPTGLAVYRHDAAIEGVTTAFNDNATQNDTKDYRNARVALERIADPGNNDWTYTGDTMAHKIPESDARSGIRQNGFDVWVLVPPNGYYTFHRDSRPSGLAPWNDRLAVTAVEGARNGRAVAAETVAQEIGHRLASDPYRNPSSGGGMSNPLAQRDDDGTDAANRDFDHARHLRSNNDGSTPRDRPGLVSRAYSLAEGEFVVPTGTRWRGGYDVVDVTSGRPARFARMEGFMSYSGRTRWTDSLITRDIVDSDLNRDPGNFRTFQLFGGLEEVSASAADGGDSGDGSGPTLSGVQVAEERPGGPDEERLAEAESVVDVTVYGPDGEPVATARTPAESGVDGDGVGDEPLAGDTSFAVEFPPDAVEVSFEAETGELRANPITRPIREAYGRLPEEAFATDREAARDRLETTLGDVDEDMQAGEYGSARDTLRDYATEVLPAEVDPEFEPLANQRGRDRMEALFDEMIGRLDGLATDGAGE